MHADYEVPVLTFTDPSGAELRVVRHYTDGIIIDDPVKLVVYDSDNNTVAETPYCADVLTHRASGGDLHVFGLHVHGPSWWFPRGWSLEGRSLVPLGSLYGFFGTYLMSLRQRWLGYALAVLPCVAAMLSFLSSVREAGTFLVSPGGWEIAALFWPLLIILYTPLSNYLVLILSALVCLLCAESQGEALFIGGAFFSYPMTGWLLLLLPNGRLRREEREQRRNAIAGGSRQTR